MMFLKNKKLHYIMMRLIEFFISTPLKILPIRNLIIFESHSDFCDNSKALFNKMLELGINKKFEIVWLVENKEKFEHKDLVNIKFVSIKRDTILEKIVSEIKNSILFSQCKYHFFSHRNFARIEPKKGQVFFNLTHGLSIKNSTGKHNTNVLKCNYILVTSEFTGKLRVKSYQGGEDKLKIFGFPRNSFFFYNNDCLNSLNIDKKKYKKVIIWMPTFRRQKSSSRNDSGTKSETDLPILKNDKDITKLNIHLCEKEILLIIKPHPAQDMKFYNDISSDNIITINNEVLLEQGIELYELLGECDALITDYSSVYLDYLITNKPIGFTIDDVSDYAKNLGFLVENPIEYMPGPKIDTLDDMIEFINSIYNNIDVYIDERKRICELFHKYKDDKASDRIIEFLEL